MGDDVQRPFQYVPDDPRRHQADADDDDERQQPDQPDFADRGIDELVAQVFEHFGNRQQGAGDGGKLTAQLLTVRR